LSILTVLLGHADYSTKLDADHEPSKAFKHAVSDKVFMKILTNTENEFSDNPKDKATNSDSAMAKAKFVHAYTTFFKESLGSQISKQEESEKKKLEEEKKQQIKLKKKMAVMDRINQKRMKIGKAFNQDSKATGKETTEENKTESKTEYCDIPKCK